jgi:hypothetical protein
MVVCSNVDTRQTLSPYGTTLYKVEKVEERYFWQIDVLRG